MASVMAHIKDVSKHAFPPLKYAHISPRRLLVGVSIVIVRSEADLADTSSLCLTNYSNAASSKS